MMNFECFSFKLNRYLIILTLYFKLQITCIGLFNTHGAWMKKAAVNKIN